jgi:excisionase family DNA binding protein
MSLPDERYFTVKEAAEQLGWYFRSVYRAVGAGRLRAVRFGRGRGTLRIPESAINEITTPREVDPRVEYAPQPKPKRRKKA